MKVIVQRKITNEFATISKILVEDSSLFIPFIGLEDPIREEKIPGKTCIPAGVYKIGVRDFGSFHERYKSKFSNFHKGMLEILEVPNFTNILIHIGNSPSDTDGCLLIGNSYAGSKNYIFESKKAYKRFYKLVIDDALKGDVTIEFQNQTNPIDE